MSAVRFSKPARVITTALVAAFSLAACSSGVDVSDDGQIDYACALIDDIKENNPRVTDWDMKIGDETPNEMIQAMAAASLVGAATGGGAGVSENMHEAGVNIVRGISTINEEHIQNGVDAMARECASLAE